MTLKERLKQFDLLPQIDEENDAVLSPELSSVCNGLSKVLSEKIASIPVWFDYSIDEQKQLIQSFLNCKLNEEFSEIRLTDAEKNRIFAVFLSSVHGFGSLDFFISKESVSAIIVNSTESVLVVQGGSISNSEIVFDKKQFEVLNKKLWTLSGTKSENIVKFRYSNLLITLIAGTISSSKIIIEKIADKKYNLNDLVETQIITSEAKEYISSLIQAKRNILLVAPENEHFLLNSLVNEIATDGSVTLFENLNIINLVNPRIERFSVFGLSDVEIDTLINSVKIYQPDYVVSDVWNGSFNQKIIDNFKKSAYILTSTEEAYVAAENDNKNSFDYIIKFKKTESGILLDCILETLTDDNGGKEFKEVLKFNNQTYEYELLQTQNIPNVNNPTPINEQPKNGRISFRARFE